MVWKIEYLDSNSGLDWYEAIAVDEAMINKIASTLEDRTSIL